MDRTTDNTRIMVIDDSHTVRVYTEKVLTAAGYQVLTAVDGFDALAQIPDYEPHLIFVDIMMPRLDGYQTCALIKNNSRFKATPIVMFSSKDGLFDRARGRIAGCDQYLTKPFSKDEILDTVKELIVVEELTLVDI